jgi:signal transduction histidine kinase
MPKAVPIAAFVWALLVALLLWPISRANAQANLSPAITQSPPFADASLDQILRKTLVHMDAFDADSSLLWINLGLRHIEGKDAPEELYYLLTYRAEVLYYEGLFTEAMQDLDRSMPLAERLGDSLLVANVYNLRGLLHENIQQSRVALPYMRKALSWYPAAPSARYPVTELYHIHGNLGSYLMNAGRLDSAAMHLPISLKLAQAAKASRATAVAWWSLGRLGLLQQQPDSALRCFERCIAWAIENNEHDVRLDGYSGLALAQAKLGMRDAARATLEEGRRHCTAFPNGIGQVTLRNFERDRSITLKLIEDPAGALEAIGQWHKLDSMITSRNTQAALHIQSELLKSDAALTLERVQKERYAEALERVRFSRTVIVAGSILAIVVLLGVYFGYRSRQRGKQRLAELELRQLHQEKTIAELRIREQVGRDMHDDLGAGLSGLKLRSEMAARAETDPDKRARYVEMARQAGELIGSMRQIIWAMNSDQGSLADLVAYATGYARNYLAENGLGAHIKAEGPWPVLQLTTEQRRNLFLVMKEALHNVVKHASARNVHISIEWKGESDHGTLGVTVTDDGVGNANSEALAGNGMRNMRQRTSALGGTLTVSSGNGTSVQYTVPLAPTNKGSIANSMEQPHLRTHDSRGTDPHQSGRG